MGQPPQPFYDPLAFAIEQAHARGLELHAWFNPYRARHPSAKSPISANHVSRTKPGLVREYGRHLWLDPGEKAVQDHSLAVVMDVVRRYDVDGIHFDDYFYPYRERDAQKRPLDFPDEASWRRFGEKTGLARDDWRRENVNQFVQRVHDSVRAAKPWVSFGISPFGIWRPGNPPQIAGLDAYAELYADSRKWLNQGWVDYFVPQLYWAIEPPAQSFPVLLKWWASENKKSRLLYPGLDSTKVPRRWQPSEIQNQIALTRQSNRAQGHVHWNMKSLMRNPDFAKTLAEITYAEPALAPVLPGAGSRPAQPRAIVTGPDHDRRLVWSPDGAQKTKTWVVQTRRSGKWTTTMLPAGKSSHKLAPDVDAVALTAVSRAGAASPPKVLEKKR
jgi:uncharacterized lipoprotein YddW (UPF0748 family)